MQAQRAANRQSTMAADGDSVMLATFNECFEISNKELCDIDNKFDAQFEDLEELMEKVAEAQRMADVVVAVLNRTRNTLRGTKLSEKCLLAGWNIN